MPTSIPAIHHEIKPKDTPKTVSSPPGPRSALGLGYWFRADARYDDNFASDPYFSEPHLHRRRTILKEYPQMTKLYGTSIETMYISIMLTACQILLAYHFGRRYAWMREIQNLSWNMTYWSLFVFSITVVGGTLSAMVGVIVHETCHNLVHPVPLVNRIVGFIANAGMLVPVASSFKRYHLEHHAWQGVPGKDPDLPLEWEITLIRGNAFLKLLWLCMYPFMYAIRGMVVGRSVTRWEMINTAVMLVIDMILCPIVGKYGTLYLALSLWFGYSFHPVAAHFIQEHYTFVDHQETYSYYGWMNAFSMNMGLHNEHHDFPRIPWTKLYAVTLVAPEFYDPLKSFTSWTGVHWRFLTDKTMGPVSRISRTREVHRQDRIIKL
jgi:sphingolipid 4-desaturase/C4-monooxygenase